MSARGPARAHRLRDRAARTFLVGSACGWVGLLVLAPLAAILYGAFREGPARFFSSLLGDGGRHALLLTVALAALAAVVNGVFGTLIAWVLVRERFRGRALLNSLVDLPFAISPVIIGFALLLVLGPRGWLGPLVEASGAKIVFAWPAMAIATIFVSIPFVIREVALVLEQADLDQEQAAYTLGAGAFTTFIKVTLPNIRWGLVYGVLLTTARSLGEFGAVLVVSGGIANATETGTLFVFRSLDDRRDLAAYSMSVALAGLSLALLLAMELVKRRVRRASGAAR